MLKSMRFLIILIGAIIIFLGVNIAAKSTLYKYKIDLTDGKIFTINPESKKLLENLKEPVHLRLFYTNKLAQGLPVFQAYNERVKSILRQYSEINPSKITLEFINPEPFTQKEDLAVSHGIEGIDMDGAGSKFYFGLSIENSTDERAAIAFFDPDRGQFLEYDLTKLISNVVNSDRKKVGLISNLPVHGGGEFQVSATLQAPQREWAIIKQIGEQFNLRDIPKTAEFIPDDIEILLLIHPHNFSAKTYYAIEQFLLRGGKAMIFMDSSINLAAQEFTTSDFSRLLEHWGIEFSGDMVAQEKANAINVSSLASSSRLTSYPKITWLEIKKDNLAQDSVITKPLERILMIESGFFSKQASSTMNFNPLISTSEAAAAIKAEQLTRDNPEQSLELYNNFVPQGKKLNLAAHISGETEANIKLDELEYQDDKIKKLLEARHLSKSKQPINVILVGDTDMLRNEFWARISELFGQEFITPEADNGAFVLNSLEFLSGDNALINLRSRGNQVRRFTLLDNLRKSAEQSFAREEAALKSKLTELEGRLKQLQNQNNDELFTAEQTKEIANFRQLFLQTRKQLRAVQSKLNHDIEKIGTRLALANILIMPIILLLMALIMPAILRKLHMKKIKKS